MPQIMLSKELSVNLGQDEHGEPRIVTLSEGLQEVDTELAEHWFVKAHAQEIISNVVLNQELQDTYTTLKAEYDALLIQSNEANKKITALEKQAKADAEKISELQRGQ